MTCENLSLNFSSTIRPHVAGKGPGDQAKREKQMLGLICLHSSFEQVLHIDSTSSPRHIFTLAARQVEKARKRGLIPSTAARSSRDEFAINIVKSIGAPSKDTGIPPQLSTPS